MAPEQPKEVLILSFLFYQIVLDAQRGQKRPTGNKLFEPGVYPKVKTFQASRTQQVQVPFLGKYNFINSEILVMAYDGKTN
ncbi:MAG: hypothetical protein ACE5IY_19945, partial [bacterium]